MTQNDSLRLEWDREKNDANRRKHGLGFEEATALFTSGCDYLEIFDDDHSDREERFIAIGPIERGVIVVTWTQRPDEGVRIISARPATRDEVAAYQRHMQENR
jgi:uncharacterized DUF497 family protein